MPSTRVVRRLTVGAEMQEEGADVRVWAPTCRTVDLVIPEEGRGERVLPMAREEDGHFHVCDPEARAGGRYWFRLDGDRLRPDPGSPGQPEGPHEPSAYVDPRAFGWTDAAWRGLSKEGQVVYELHI